MNNKIFKLLSFFAVITIFGCKGKIPGVGGSNNPPDAIVGTKEGELEKVYNALKDKINNKALEILDFNDYFSKNNINQYVHNNNTIRIKVVSEKDKNKIVEYDYDYVGDNITGPTPVTLSEGMGSNEKFIEKYEEFKPFLFTEKDMPDWKKIPAMFADAIKRSEYGTDCYVKDYTVERAQNETGAVEARISVQSNKSITASKSFTYDAAGNFIR